MIRDCRREDKAVFVIYPRDGADNAADNAANNDCGISWASTVDFP